MILSNTGAYDTVRVMFEEMENNKDQKIRANAQLCLSRMYHYGKGVEKDEALADLYANKAFSNGNSEAMIYRERDINIHTPDRLPEQLIITDYNCSYITICYSRANEENSR
jgi:TPR repeat protein